MPSLIMPLITACVMLGGTHEIRCVESTPPLPNFVAEHVPQGNASTASK